MLGLGWLVNAMGCSVQEGSSEVLVCSRDRLDSYYSLLIPFYVILTSDRGDTTVVLVSVRREGRNGTTGAFGDCTCYFSCLDESTSSEEDDDLARTTYTIAFPSRRWVYSPFRKWTVATPLRLEPFPQRSLNEEL
jgi:hypothetical protein